MRTGPFPLRTTYRSNSFEFGVTAAESTCSGAVGGSQWPAASCPVCGHEEWRLLFTAPDTVHRTSQQYFPVAECTDCGLGRTVFPEGRSDAADLYPSSYVYHDAEPLKARRASRKASRRVAEMTGSVGYWRWCDPEYADLEEVGKAPGRVLDIGCGAGRYLRRFSELGWQVEGVEPSASAASVARQRGFPVQTASAEDAEYPSDTFDLVTMYHSLEHCERPQLVVEHALKALRPRGVLAVALCNFDSPGLRFFGAVWPKLEVPRHRFHYTPAALSRLVARWGGGTDAVYYHSDLGDLPTALRSWAHIPPQSSSTHLPSDSGGRGIGRSASSARASLDIGRLLTLTYGPLLQRANLSLRSSFLARFRRP